MFEPWSVVTPHDGAESEDELRDLFGEEAVITRVGRFNLIHLDHPSQEEIERRKEDFDPNQFFEDDCPLCQMLREQGGCVVYETEP